ncbi:unnamed protein product [Vitrella brassicaformis CCMP3155]|uniref:Uncharacterized protein n=2 Tax=Vitrella brassicaformis TaxID=1169539 RepID=A0A0G4H4V8_VITBC|nr:unnamed protein product [Vitrella brassicaformis CCMP3155]|mmetsp:Transcript_21645/g.53024  ORF Transcript_21645/g.53024 Transcript_21645/m.53024 type:complete len:245 (+) Transcript_21645:39-773(+)|eukprot:CEM38826.1 unnamed protein product [Vitrella brassicaformis CCMP3155]
MEAGERIQISAAISIRFVVWHVLLWSSGCVSAFLLQQRSGSGHLQMMQQRQMHTRRAMVTAQQPWTAWPEQQQKSTSPWPVGERAVGLFDGRNVYRDGYGGYTIEVNFEGERLPIKPQFYQDIKFCFETEDETAARRSVLAGFTEAPSGAFYQIVTPGEGPSPTIDDMVRFDDKAWRDTFNGQKRWLEESRRQWRVSDVPYDWKREALTAMRVGEVRLIVVPTEMTGFKGPKYSEIKLNAILSS